MTPEEKFKKSPFADPKQTKKTMDKNLDEAEEIANFAHTDCGEIPVSEFIFPVKKLNKKSRVILPGK